MIVGEQDLLTPPWVAREVASGIPGARFELITGDGSSHVLPLADGEPATATAELAVALEMADDIGVGLPSVVPVLPDAIEAAALVGDTAWCAQLSGELDRQAAAVRRRIEVARE